MYEWHPGKLPTHMEPDQWRTVLEMLLGRAPSSEIAIKTGQNIKQILKAVGYTRLAMATDIPVAFSELVADIQALHPDFSSQESGIFGLILHKDYIWFVSIGKEKPVTESLTGLTFSAFVDRKTFEIVDAKQESYDQLTNYWTEAKRILTGRSGLRSEKFGLYLAESIWRHNHRKQSCTSQIEHLLRIIGTAWYQRNKK